MTLVTEDIDIAIDINIALAIDRRQADTAKWVNWKVGWNRIPKRIVIQRHRGIWGIFQQDYSESYTNLCIQNLEFETYGNWTFSIFLRVVSLRKKCLSITYFWWFLKISAGANNPKEFLLSNVRIVHCSVHHVGELMLCWLNFLSVEKASFQDKLRMERKMRQSK